MVERHEGPESAAIAAHWLEPPAGGFAVFRGRGAEPLGFLAQLALHAADRRRPAPRPRRARRVGARPAPRAAAARRGGAAGRFFMDRDAYQAPSRSFNVVTMRRTREWLAARGCRWYYLAFADADAVAPMMAYIDFERAPDADFEVGGRRYGVFARDWRREGAVDWLERMGERELGGEAAPRRRRRRGARLALSQAEFAEAVRGALRDLHDPGALATTRCCAPAWSACGGGARAGGAGASCSRARSARCAPTRATPSSCARSTAPICAPRRPRRPPPSCSGCRSARTAGISRAAWSASSTGSGSASSTGRAAADRQKLGRTVWQPRQPPRRRCARPHEPEVARCDGSASTQW